MCGSSFCDLPKIRKSATGYKNKTHPSCFLVHVYVSLLFGGVVFFYCSSTAVVMLEVERRRIIPFSAHFLPILCTVSCRFLQFLVLPRRLPGPALYEEYLLVAQTPALVSWLIPPPPVLNGDNPANVNRTRFSRRDPKISAGLK